MRLFTLLTRGSLLALSLWAVSARADERLEARRHFRLGMGLIEQGLYEEGIEELQEAYATKPHPNVLYNIARAYGDWGQLGEALKWYRRYLNTRPPDESAVAATVARLEKELAQQNPEPARTAEPAPPPLAEQPPSLEATSPAMAALMERFEKAVARAEALEAALAQAPTPSPEGGRVPGEGGEAALGAGTDLDSGSVPYEERVVTASRRAQSSLEAPNATTVITAEDIRLSGAITLFDLLRRVPGAEVMALGVASANVSLRGFNQRLANKVLVLVDGRTEYQDFLGLTLWSAFPVGLEEIERIEVIRGPGSALYGANAMLGVVNIITRAPGLGPQAQFQGLAGTGNTFGGSFIGYGAGEGLRYRTSVGYQQTDKWSRDFEEGRPDVQRLSAEQNVGLRSARANITSEYRLAPQLNLGASGGVNRFSTEIYPLGLLRNYYLDGFTAYVMGTADAGPVRIKAFWNHLNADAGPQYDAIGQRSLETQVISNVFNAEAIYGRGFELLGPHQINIGGETRVKRVSWDYLGEDRQQVHVAAFIQDEWRPHQDLRLVASYRVDRHPLLNKGKPGLAQSPRLSAVYIPAEGHAFRLTTAAAFREPTLLESYTSIAIPLPGVNGASALTTGSTSLSPERLVSFELGYRGENADLGMDWDVALYQQRVSNLIALSALQPLPAGESYDAASGSFLLGQSFFRNEPGRYGALGLEAGLNLSPLDGLGLKAATALQKISVSDDAVGTCGPCSQAPTFKFFAGITYRARQTVDLGLDGTFTSSTIWIEREPAASDPTRIDFLANALPSYFVLNARVNYAVVPQRVSISLLGSNLAASHQQHPFGNRIERRVLAMLTVTP